MLPSLVDVVDVEAPVARVLGVEGDREQPLLAAVEDAVGGCRGSRASSVLPVADDPDRPRLLDDEQEIRRARRVVDVDRRVEAADPGERQRRRRCAVAGDALAERAATRAKRQRGNAAKRRGAISSPARAAAPCSTRLARLTRRPACTPARRARSRRCDRRASSPNELSCSTLRPSARSSVAGRLGVGGEAVQLALAEVAVQVAAVQRRSAPGRGRRSRRSPSSRGRARTRGPAGSRPGACWSSLKRLVALERRPAEVEPAARAGRRAPRRSPRACPGRRRRSRGRPSAVERESPRVAQPERRELEAPRAGWDRFAASCRAALEGPGRALRVAGAAAVADAEVEASVGAEQQQAAVVVRGEVVDLRAARGRSRGRRVAGSPAERRYSTIRASPSVSV